MGRNGRNPLISRRGPSVAVAETNPVQPARLDPEILSTMYAHMLRARLLDERMWVLNRQGRAPFWISGMGHEAIQVAAGMVLRPGHDWIAPYYRDLALTLVVGMTPRDHLLSVLARADDPNSGGRQMPAHYGSRRHNIISTGSPVATQLLHAAGVALAARLRNEDSVCITSLGEGSTSGGDFHEALNFAATHRLPFVCVVENNGFAISVPWQKQMPTEDVADRARAYGIPGVKVDGGDAAASYQVMREAVDRARSGGGPTLVEAKVARLTSHSSDDDQRRYRSAEDIAAEKQNDCLERLQDELLSAGILTADEIDGLAARYREEIDAATDEAEAAPLPEPESALRHVYGDR